MRLACGGDELVRADPLGAIESQFQRGLPTVPQHSSVRPVRLQLSIDRHRRGVLRWHVAADGDRGGWDDSAFTRIETELRELRAEGERVVARSNLQNIQPETMKRHPGIAARQKARQEFNHVRL